MSPPPRGHRVRPIKYLTPISKGYIFLRKTTVKWRRDRGRAASTDTAKRGAQHCAMLTQLFALRFALSSAFCPYQWKRPNGAVHLICDTKP